MDGVDNRLQEIKANKNEFPKFIINNKYLLNFAFEFIF